ncbi:MAG: hypothetical protein AMXMBFR4_32720 [Candidatus Hydrogenedentota bacterium]
MIMADVFKILFLILGSLIVTVSYWLLFEALLPGTVERAKWQYEKRPVRVALVGALIGMPLFIAGLALANGAALVKLIGIALVCSLIFLGLLGSTGLARLIGTRLASAADPEFQWRRVLRGGTVLSITFVLPVIGWFFVLPLTLASGLGSLVLAWWEARRRARSETSAARSVLPT